MARRSVGAAPTNATDLVTKGYVDSVAGAMLVDSSQTGAFAAVVNTVYIINWAASLGAQQVVLPITPAQGSIVEFFREDNNSYSTFVQVVASTGDSIVGLGPLPYILTTGNGIKFAYIGTTWYPTSTSIGGTSGLLGFSSTAAFPPNLMSRDSAGRSQVATPVAAADIANKGYVDSGNAGRMRYGGAWSSSAGYAPNDVVTVNNSEYVCISQVVAPGGTALVASGAWTAPSNASTAPLLPNSAAAGDVLVLGIAWTGTTATETTPITGATKQNVAVYGTGSVRASLYTYTLTATDIGNGYLTLAAQPATTTAQVMPYHLIRNFLAVNKTPLGTNGYNNSVTAQTPTSYPAWSYAMDWAGTASTTPSLAQASETNLVQGFVASQLVAAMGYEVVASGTNTARAFTGTNVTAATGGSYGFILSTTSGTPNPSPDLDPTHWVKLADANPAGALQMYAGAAAPAGWLLCDGTSVSRASYPALFLALNSGNIYGTVDSTHFNLPDLRQRFPYGNNATASTLAATGGTATHTHPLSDAGQAAVTVGGNPAITTIRRVTSQSWTANITSTGTTTAGTTTGATTQGSGLLGNTDAAATLPPYITVNFIIKT